MGNDANLVNSVRRYPICRMHTHFIIKGYFFLMFQEPLPDRLVQKHAGNLTVPVRKNDIQIDCLVPKLQCTLTKTTKCTCMARTR